MPFRRAALAAPILLILLAGCVPQGSTPTPDPTLVAPSLTPNPTPTITPTPGPETVPVAFACADVLPAQAIYDYNPNVSLLPSFSPDSGSPAGQAIAQQGLACSLVNQTSGVTIDFGIVQYTDEAWATKTAAVAGSSTPSSDFDGYFDVVDGVGTAQALAAPYYLTVTSAEFTSPADIAPLVAIARGYLG